MAVLCNTTDSHLTATVVGAPDTGDPITISCWMSATWSTALLGAKSFVGIYGPSAAAPVTAIQIGSRTTANAVYVWTYGGGTLVNTGGGAVTDGVNHFIVYTFDGGTHRIYVDGALQATSVAAQIDGQFNTFFINGYPPTGSANETSTHIVESVRLYNRALSAAEIQTMHASRGARHNIIDGLLAYYEFDELTTGQNTTLVYDLAGRSTPANMTWVGGGTPTTYTYPSGEGKLRPAVVN